MNILAIDDEPGALKLLVKAINNVCPDAVLNSFLKVGDAYAFASSNPVDVLFSDIHMRGTDGIEFARKIQLLHPNVNIIFTTGYSEHAVEAINLRTSGYILKPITPKAVKKELESLRNPIENNIDFSENPVQTLSESVNIIFIKAFGNFDVFHNGKPVRFRKFKAKEMLAYLVDRAGSSVTRKELASVLFEEDEYSRSTQSYITQIIKSLKENLVSEGIDNILIIDNNNYSVDTNYFECDAYCYAKDKNNSPYKYNGEYMTQYSWAETSSYRFFNNLIK